MAYGEFFNKIVMSDLNRTISTPTVEEVLQEAIDMARSTQEPLIQRAVTALIARIHEHLALVQQFEQRRLMQ